MSRHLFLASSAFALVWLSWLGLARAVEKRLDYRQQQALQDARYYLDQVAGLVPQIEKISADWKVGDAAVPINQVRNMMAERARSARYLQNAAERFKQLPAERAEVAAQAKRLETLGASLDALEKKLAALDAALSAVVKQGETPDYKADFDRLREINSTFANPGLIRERPERAVEVVKQVGPAKAERQRIAAKYQGLLNQPTGQAQQMREVLAQSDKVVPAFEKAGADFVAEAPAEISALLDEALKLAAGAVAAKKPVSLSDRLGRAQTLLDLLSALAPDAEATRQSRAKLEAARASVKETTASLTDSIIASNAVPASRYDGPDSAALNDLVTAKWAKDGNGAEVLKVGVNSQKWQRDTRAKWSEGSSSWYKVDTSWIQGFVVVKAGETQAVVHYVNLVKDHMAGDSITAHLLNKPAAEPDVSYRLLIRNVR